MNFTTDIAADGTYDIDGDTMGLALVEIYNAGPGSVYYGDIPGAPLVLLCDGASGVLSVQTTEVAGLQGAYTDVQQGMVATGDGITGSVVITKVQGRSLTTDGTPTSAGDLITFTPPDIDDETGIPILPEATPVRFSKVLGNAINQQGLRIVADSAGATIVVRRKRN